MHHTEHPFLDTVRNVVMGMSDELNVPFALTAGLAYPITRFSA